MRTGLILNSGLNPILPVRAFSIILLAGMLLLGLYLSNFERDKLLSARVTDIIDGDTIRVIIRGEEKRVRLAGIDAPELGEGGEKSRDFLTIICPPGTPVELELLGRDRYGRLLAVVYLKGINLNELLVRENLAERICSF